VFVTAGDAGANQYYWLSRERGAEAAYSVMAGASEVWENRTIQLADKEYATFANPRGNSTITLVFLHLPDGNLTGGGFKTSHFESLAKLYTNKLQVIHAVDGQSTYTKAQLVTALMNLMSTFSPTEIHTQSAYVGTIYHDHSDHNTVGALTQLAYVQYEQQQFDNQIVIPIKYYVGYPVHTLPPNVSSADLQTKAAIYFAYSKFDGSVCHTDVECRTASTLGLYLRRQYEYAY
jgi:LmbE family N-acetylglucosaminyl deacetylase